MRLRAPSIRPRCCSSRSRSCWPRWLSETSLAAAVCAPWATRGCSTSSASTNRIRARSTSSDRRVCSTRLGSMARILRWSVRLRESPGAFAVRDDRNHCRPLGHTLGPGDPKSPSGLRQAEVGRRSMMAYVKDPVCGMEVDASTDLKFEYDGVTYYFCSRGCKLDFEEDPDKYLDPNYESHMWPPGGRHQACLTPPAWGCRRACRPQRIRWRKGASRSIWHAWYAPHERTECRWASKPGQLTGPQEKPDGLRDR